VYDTFQRVNLTDVLYCANTPAGNDKQPSFAALFELYTSLRHGKPLRQWITENKHALGGIDIRRFISFGVIKGFLYRVHRYPILGDFTNGDRKTNEKRPPALR
jgi:nitrogen permease regulator 2-like protein